MQFCSDFEVTSSDIYIDSSVASTRVTNCTCALNMNTDTHIYLKTTLNKTNDCRSRIIQGFDILPMLMSCTEIDTAIVMKTFQTFILTLINEEINIKKYCLHLSTGNVYIYIIFCQYKILLTVKSMHFNATV